MEALWILSPTCQLLDSSRLSVGALRLWGFNSFLAQSSLYFFWVGFLDREKCCRGQQGWVGSIIDIEKELSCPAHITSRHSATIWLPWGDTESWRKNNTIDIISTLTWGFHYLTVWSYDLHFHVDHFPQPWNSKIDLISIGPSNCDLQRF